MHKILIFLTLIGIIACNPKINLDEEKQKLMEVDRKFSQRSAQVGNFQAFVEFAMEDAVLIQPNHLPIIGRAEIKRVFETKSDSAYVLTWEPSYARVAESNDLGYTFGIYQLKMISGEEEGKIYRGTYTAIWARNKKGKWRFVLDTGYSGIGNTE